MKKQIITLSVLALCLLLGLALFRIGTVSAQALETAQWAYEEENGEIRLMRYLGSEQTVTVPAQLDGKPVTALGDGAMAGIPTTVSITVESGVATVGEEAFSDCPNLASVTLPDSVTSIGRRAFRYCMALKSVTLPKTLAELPYQGFWDCQSLESIVIPDGVTTIPNGFLYNGFALQEVTVPGSVTAIEKNAFHACTHLNYISLSENVTQFDDMAFSDCDFLVILAPEGSAAALFAQEYGYVPETVVYETPHPYTEDVSYTHTEPGRPSCWPAIPLRSSSNPILPMRTFPISASASRTFRR